MDIVDLLLHPVRLRIVHTFSGGRSRTTAELCTHLRDVPKTSVYRHVGLLVDGGVLEVAEEQRVRGAVERHYRLRPGRPMIADNAGASMSLNDHRQGLTSAIAALLAEFNTYLDQPGASPFADSIGYRQGVFWLSPDELTEMLHELRAVFASRLTNQPVPGRIPRLMSLIQFPAGHESTGSPNS